MIYKIPFRLKKKIMEFLDGLVVKGPGVVTAMAQVTAVVWVQSLAQEFIHAQVQPPYPYPKKDHGVISI